jgi:nondiscriminating glutamyl-tRNA synthetase
MKNAHSNTSGQVVTRFAPSPTGKAHAGSYRTAMYSWLFARKHGGKFILRIEDTDTARNSEEAKQDISEALEWLGIDNDAQYIQSEHLARHQELLQKMIDENKAYVSHEEAKDGSGAMKDVIRFRNPNKVVLFNDLIRGNISTDTTDLGDFVIARTINEPLFHLAVVIDDHDEGITHVIRAEEHIANTPRQILLHEALGFSIPEYAHLPLVLGTDKQKLSKRKGALPMTDYAREGYLPDALFNCIAMIGWNPADPGSDQEIFSKEELIQRFDFARMQKGGAVFNIEKLNWFNREYIKKLSSEAFWMNALPFIPGEYHHTEILKKLENVLRDRIEKFADIKTLFMEGEFDYFFNEPKVDEKMLVWKALKEDPEGLQKTKDYLRQVRMLLEQVPTELWQQEAVKDALSAYAEKEGRGNVLWPLRVALSGKEKSPDPFELASMLGKEKTLARIQAVV